MTYMTSKNERNLSVLFCWSLGPDQGDVLCRVGMSSCLVSISHLSKSFNDVQIFYIPKNFPRWALLNQHCSSLSTDTSIPLRLNFSTRKISLFVVLFRSKKFLYLVIRYKKGLCLCTKCFYPFFHLLTYTNPNILMDAKQ